MVGRSLRGRPGRWLMMGHLGLTDCLAEGVCRYHHSGLVARLEECCYLCYLAAWWQHSWRDNAG